MIRKDKPVIPAAGETRAVDAYISTYPPGVRMILEQLRKVIHETAPGAQEAIRYGIPTFMFHGTLVHFGVFKQHIGFYPTPSVIRAFKDELRPYPHAKGSIRFPLDKEIPLDLVRKMVRFRVDENLALAKAKG
ncbi:MAG: hypothetical protein BWY93_00954 [Euryarchaeota archaeon ADurb.BinA087]|nr:MAG: hypothetical protein BWY93_00954 [Euryarchaeota archaeon ADurb.BinA087]HQA81650.1 DUF1801 domain-containing protein [Methanoregulaceae archaeon]